MKNRFCARNVFEKFETKPLTFRSALDESRDIGDDKTVIRAEMRFERCKRVICDPAFCRSERVEQARFSRIGESHKPDIRDEPQLEPIRHGIARFTFLVFLG